MDIVRLLFALIAILLPLAIIYVVIMISSKKVQKDIKKESILKCIKNKDENCGSCNGNCEKFVEELIAGTKTVEDCPKISMTTKEEIKNLLDVSAVPKSKKVAYVFCKGGARASDQYKYVGVNTCSYSNKLFDGHKVCALGCQGCMDCAKVCPTGAIIKNKCGVAEVDRSLCIGCGECVKKCPDNIIKLVDIDQKIMVSCKQALNQAAKDEVKDFCSAGCTKCGKCVEACKTKALYFENDILKYDKEKCIKCNKCVFACPNSTITMITSDFIKK